MNAASIVFLTLFSVAIFFAYVVIRRGILSPKVAGALCGLVTMVSLLGFGVAYGLGTVHIIVTALVVAPGFTLGMMLMAAFFRANEPSKAELEAYLPKSKSNEVSQSGETSGQ